jgi:hypothetical protein
MMGLGRTYILTGAERGAYLTALNKDGRQIWLSQFPAPRPIRGEGIEWTIEEPKDRKEVILTWRRPNESIKFRFDTNSGQLLAEEGGAAPNATRRDAQQSERLERLEKAVEDLRKRLQPPAPAHHSSTATHDEYLNALANLDVARSRVARFKELKQDEVSRAAELDHARFGVEKAEKLVQSLSEQTKADSLAAEAASKLAKATYERAKQLHAHGAISQEHMDAAEAEAAKLNLRLQSAEDAREKIKSLQSRIKELEREVAALRKFLEQQLQPPPAPGNADPANNDQGKEQPRKH